MKKILYILLTAAIVAGCSNNKETEPEMISGTINVTAAISLDGEPATKAEPTPLSGYQLRYILEVYSGTGLYKRYEGSTGVFDVRLIKDRSYDFLFWADYVPTSAPLQDKHYTTNKLTNVKTKVRSYIGSDPSRDAFCGVVKSSTLESVVASGVTLKRPFAKLEFVNTTTLTANQAVTISYISGFYNEYSVLTGVASTSGAAVTPTYPNTLAGQTVAWDYLFVNRDATISSLNCTLAIDNGTPRAINGDLLKANTRTIITGNFTN